MARETKLCTFHLDKMFFGVDVMRVQEVIRQQEMTRVPLADGSVRGLINLRGQIVTAIDLRQRLRLPPDGEHHGLMNVIVRTADGAVSFLVDDIDEVVTVDDSTFAPVPTNLAPGVRAVVTGVHALPQRLLLLLDTEATANARAGTN